MIGGCMNNLNDKYEELAKHNVDNAEFKDNEDIN